MSLPQYTVLAILFLTITLFLWGRWRHDMVAIASLLACVITGLVLPEHAYTGFSHPAVITVACILILSRALQNSGAIDALTRWILPSNAGPTMTLLCLTGLGALLSGFMNNVGALALLMPVAILAVQTTRNASRQSTDAAGVWNHSGRHDHLDRHPAQPHRLRISR